MIGKCGVITTTVIHMKNQSYIQNPGLKPGIGLIRISSFAVNTKLELVEALAKLKKQGMKSLILDLQENGGGYLEASVGVASQFLEKVRQ